MLPRATIYPTEDQTVIIDPVTDRELINTYLFVITTSNVNISSIQKVISAKKIVNSYYSKVYL